MRSLSTAQLLDVWEDGAAASPTRRALALLALAHPELAPEALAALPIGRRDGMLAKLREHLFGSRLDLVATCPACHEQLEAVMQVSDLGADAGPEAGGTHTLVADGTQTVVAGAYRITFRLPASADLLALPAGIDADDACLLLLERCLVEARDGSGAATGAAGLPQPVLRELAQAIAAADPAADPQLAFACPACGHHWSDAFDIAGFLWRELQAWALRTLRDVDTLARAYGWREADVLALSPARREIYLELCRQ